MERAEVTTLRIVMVVEGLESGGDQESGGDGAVVESAVVAMLVRLARVSLGKAENLFGL